MNVWKIISVVTGIHWIKRTKAVMVNTAKGIKDLTENPHRGTDNDAGKYRVYSPSKKEFCYSDDFETALRRARTDDEIRAIELQSKLVRRIQAHSAILVFIMATIFAFRMHSYLPLFSIFPAFTLLAFAIQRGCIEEGYKRRRYVYVEDYLNAPGIFALWK